MTEPSPHEQRGPAKIYGDERIEVQWEPRLCIHARNCVRRLGRVFDPERHPWIDVAAAEADEIAETVLSCPTGALHFRRLDGGAQEEPTDPPTVVPRTNGPLFLRGHFRIEDADGTLLREDTRLALCRCGASANKPFCDGSHLRVGFKS
jgi:uncharacterized Fe-S cluster protein YjdI